jgi:SAM-dependent methyltransferase
MSQEAIDPLGKFDIITCDNLIEHVAVPERLIAHLRRLLNPEGVVYMTIPNAFSIGQIKKDCHYGQFGVSLLDPIDGARYVKQAIGQPTYDVSYYFPYGYYEDQFRKYGLSPILLNNYSAAEEKIAQVWESAQGLLPTEIALHQQAALPIEVSEKLSQNLRVFIRRLETDIALYYWLKGKREKQLLAGRILRDYDTELWYVVLSVRTVKLSDRIGYFTNTLEYLFKKARNRALSTYK